MNYRDPDLLAAVRTIHCVNCGIQGRTQAAHSNLLEHGKGRSIKAKDSAIMALCDCGANQCHFELDSGKNMSKAERRAFTYEMIAKTYMALIEQGKLVVAK